LTADSSELLVSMPCANIFGSHAYILFPPENARCAAKKRAS
jgi:hypothetical protein